MICEQIKDKKMRNTLSMKQSYEMFKKCLQSSYQNGQCWPEHVISTHGWLLL